MSNSISKHNVLSLYFCVCPCTHAILHALHRSSQLKWCFTRTSDDLWISLLMRLLMKRFSVLSWCRADVHCYPSNELYFGAPAEAFWKGSQYLASIINIRLVSTFIIVLGFICGAQDKLTVGKLKGAWAIFYIVLSRKQNSQRVMRTCILTAYWMAAKAVSRWIAKKNKLNQKILFSHCMNSMVFFQESSSTIHWGGKIWRVSLQKLWWL